MRRTTFIFLFFLTVSSSFLRADSITDFLFSASDSELPLLFPISSVDLTSFVSEPIGLTATSFHIPSLSMTFSNVPVADTMFLAPFSGRGGFSLETPDGILTVTGAAFYMGSSPRKRHKAQTYMLLSVASENSAIPPLGVFGIIPQMIAGVPETSTNLLVATGALGAIAMALRRNFSK